MARFAEVDAANVLDIRVSDARGVQYLEGATNLVPHFTAGTVSTLTAESGVLVDIYQVLEDLTPAPAYHRLEAVGYTFVGALGDIAARVQELRTYAPIPLEELRALKKAELDGQFETVRLSACDSSNGAGGDNWAIITSENNRNLVASIHRPLTDRDGDIMDRLREDLAAAVDFADFKARAASWINRWPGAQLVNIGIRHKTNRSEQTYPINNADDWGTVVKDIGLFDRASESAYLDAEQDIRTETDWGALATIDVVGGYAWPDHWPGA